MTIVPLTIRRYQPGDAAVVFDLHERVMRQIDAYLGPGPWNDDLLDIPANYYENGGEFLVGELDGRIVAMGAFRRTDATRAEIKRMRVDTAHQGRGYGRIMLRELEVRARQLGYDVLHLDTTAAQTAALHLYRNHGYLQTGTALVHERLAVLLFEKRLADGAGEDRLP